jgi:predicted O-methyltransferase YrrM
MFRTYRFRPSYILAKIRQYFYIKNSPEMPWLAKTANDFLVNNLTKDMVVLEFGSGRSTSFFSGKVKKIYSRESNNEWFELVKEKLKDNSDVHISYYDDLGKYADVNDIDDDSLDVVLVDGRNRNNCLLNSISKLKKGGLLILDNAERYLLYPTLSPAKCARSTRNPNWEKAEKILSSDFWRYDTTDGVSDTLLFFKR